MTRVAGALGSSAAAIHAALEIARGDVRAGRGAAGARELDLRTHPAIVAVGSATQRSLALRAITSGSQVRFVRWTMPKRAKNRSRRSKPAAAGARARPLPASTEDEISVLIWGPGAEPEDAAGWEELIASEMLGLFAQQNRWTHRNRLVAQKADCVSFEIGMETITQRQDLQTQAMLGQTGGVVWDAAVVLSRFLCRYSASLGLPVGDTARWLELGAGCGAVGIAASKLLPVPVVLSDQQSILPILQKNLLENRCTARTTLALLDWGKDGESTVELKNGFDVIVGADCVFNENLIDVLIEVRLTHTCSLAAHLATRV